MKTTQFLARLFLILLTVTAPVSAAAQPALQQRVEAALAQAPQGTRFGLVVTDDSGRELVAINPDGRFVPASNTKLLITATAYAQPGVIVVAGPGTSVALRPHAGRPPDVILSGVGDAGLSGATDCVIQCLATLADAVGERTQVVGDVVGNATLFADERWSPGMSWNNIHTRSGTGVSALSIDDNELVLRVVPGVAGQPPITEVLPYYFIDNRARTVTEGETDLDFDRLPGSRSVILTGTIAIGSAPVTLRLGIDDPAEFAAWRFRALLEARGVRVTGRTSGLYRSPGTGLPAPSPTDTPLARLTSPSRASVIIRINKESQNLSAELLLRRLGLVTIGSDGSLGDGLVIVESAMREAGVPRLGWDLSDGSGMSTYNRISPRAMIALLRWARSQPWGLGWQWSFPIAGVDGTLRSRFRGTALEGRLFAKTGTIHAANALSGYMIGASGRTLTFAFFANDMPGGASATARMDAVLLEIAAAN